MHLKDELKRFICQLMGGRGGFLNITLSIRRGNEIICSKIKHTKLEPALELQSRAVPSVEAHQCSDGPDTGRNSGGRQIIKNKQIIIKNKHTKILSKSPFTSKQNSPVSIEAAS